MTTVLALVIAALVLLLTLSWWAWAVHAARLRDRVRRLEHSRRSQSTRYGQTMEQFAPFMQDWPWDPKGFRFLGAPIDGVQFNDDEVVLVEIKSAGSRLSPVQQRVRDQVHAGRVRWEVVRID